MSGMGGYCRGKTKLGCYKNFRREVNRNKIEERYDMTMDAGCGTKQEIYRQMKKDPETGEGVLVVYPCACNRELSGRRAERHP